MLLVLKLAVAHLNGAKLLIATHVVVAKLVAAKLVPATHMGKLVKQVAVSILVEGGKTKLLSVACGFLMPWTGVAHWKLEVDTPT